MDRTIEAIASAAAPAGEIAHALRSLAEGRAPEQAERSAQPWFRGGSDELAAIARLNVAKWSTAIDLYRRLDRARNHLHANLDRSVKLRELTSIASLSAFHLARFFKLAFGTAPIAYHRRLRLERAAALLSCGLSVAAAAERTGYSDAVALTHAFRRQFGLSPRHWASRGG